MKISKSWIIGYIVFMALLLGARGIMDFFKYNGPHHQVYQNQAKATDLAKDILGSDNSIGLYPAYGEVKNPNFPVKYLIMNTTNLESDIKNFEENRKPYIRNVLLIDRTLDNEAFKNLQSLNLPKAQQVIEKHFVPYLHNIKEFRLITSEKLQFNKTYIPVFVYRKMSNEERFGLIAILKYPQNRTVILDSVFYYENNKAAITEAVKIFQDLLTNTKLKDDLILN